MLMSSSTSDHGITIYINIYIYILTRALIKGPTQLKKKGGEERGGGAQRERKSRKERGERREGGPK
jgi:hypothetical protein